ncbi:MAG: asparagine synthase-related protein [Rubrivivax sp.]|nr:asparagine synthase-related protein [Rubrivivax sp.]
MFRYLALAWDDTLPPAAALARRLALQLQACPAWQTVFLCPRLHVLVTGAAAGINEAYPLHAGQGVVLGKLFRRCDLTQPSPRHVVLDARESDAIVGSGGRALVRDHWGRHISFLADRSGRFQVLRDPSGTLPCFLRHCQGVTIVFSWLEDVLHLAPELPRPEVNADALAAQLVHGELAGRETALQGITQVLPGEIVALGGRAGPGTLLWNVFEQAQLAPIEDLPEATETLRHTVRACAQAWAGCYDSILLRLSGGVDSSILLSCLARGHSPARVSCVNYHSPGVDSDERRYARLAAALAQRELIERERVAHFSLETILHAAPMPAPVNHVGRMGSAQMDAELAAALGAAALFTGGGGDQLFFEFRQCWPAADYLRLHGIDRGFPAAVMDAARLGQVSVWRAMRLALADRLRPKVPAQTPPRSPNLFTEAALAQAAQGRRFSHPALQQAAGLPIGKRTQALQLTYPINYYDPFEREAAPELVNPLLSQPLVELCLRLPTYVLTQGGRGRALARRAFAADLPPEIANRRSKGGMEEHIRVVLLDNLDFARGLLLEGELVRRGLVDRARTEALLGSDPATLAGRAGEIHICLAIEAWLRHWPSAQAQ